MRKRPIRLDKLTISIVLGGLVVLLFILSAISIADFVLHDRFTNKAIDVYLLMSIFTMTFCGVAMIGLLGATAYMLDRTLRLKNKAIAELEPRLVAIDSAMDGIALIDARGNISYVNRTLASFYNMRRDEMLKKPWSILYNSAQNEWLRDEILPILSERGEWAGKTLGMREDGQSFYQDVSITRMNDGSLILIMRDSTKEVETADVSSRRLAAIEAADDGIGLADMHGKITYINQAYKRIHGLNEAEAAELIGKPWEHMYTDKGRAYIHDHVMPIVREHGHWRGEAPVLLKDGTVLWEEMSITLLPDGGLIGTARDISERKESEVEKESLQKQIFQAQKMEAIGRLAGGIAHDFNNLLSSIMGYAGFLIEDLPKTSEQHGFARQIMQGCRQGKTLVEQIMAFSRVRETAYEVMSLSDAVKDTVNLLLSTFPANIQVETDIRMNESYINADPVQISQTLMNLCVNARDAMDGHRGDQSRLEITLTNLRGDDCAYSWMVADELPHYDEHPQSKIEKDRFDFDILMMGQVARGQNYARLSVRDNGSGIEIGVLEKIFEPFFTTKGLNKGTGLGLSTVLGVITAMHGAIAIRSRLGSGSEFILFLPLVDGAGARLNDDKNQSAVITGQGRILLVEDEAPVRIVMSRMLSRMGYEVATCHAGDEAVDYLREHPGKFDLVLSDQSMPRMLGTEMAAQIRLDFPEIPIILLSGYSREKLEAEMKENPSIRAVLRKPVEAEELSQKIADVLKITVSA